MLNTAIDNHNDNERKKQPPASLNTSLSAVEDGSPAAGMIEHALAYAGRGWPVFPIYETQGEQCACRNAECKHQGKHPRTRNGLTGASVDEETIKYWWGRWPNANIGIATGDASGLYVLDVDEGGEEALCDYPARPDTPETITGSGGTHVLFRRPAGDKFKSQTGILPDLDIRADGGYIVAPPSIHKSGDRYEWELGPDTPLADPPQWLLDVAQGKGKVRPVAAANDAGEGLPAYIADMLSYLPADDRDDWLHVGMALHHADPFDGLAIWDEWSQSSEKYDAKDLQRVWHSFGNEGAPITIASVRRKAVVNGYQPPRDDQRALPVGWLQPLGDLMGMNLKIEWLIKHWVQRDALIMVHGPSGVGKSFTVIDMALHMTTDRGHWMDKPVKPSPVVYLAGEGHKGIVERSKAWLINHEVDQPGPLYVSSGGTDLNNKDSLAEVIDSVHGMADAVGENPGLIVVDTLHRFFDGDENSAQDAGTLIRACDALRVEFGCAVLLVHHTGLADGAQKRARGSSAWRAALDIEMSVTRKGVDSPIVISQTKTKDFEERPDLFLDLQTVDLGEADEDGDAITSAVIVKGDQLKNESPRERWGRVFVNAWLKGRASGGGMPQVPRGDLITAMVDDGLSDSSAKQQLKSGRKNFLADMVEGDRPMIRKSENGKLFTATDVALKDACSEFED